MKIPSVDKAAVAKFNSFWTAVFFMLLIITGFATFLILFGLVNASTEFKHLVGSLAVAYAVYLFIVSTYRGVNKNV
jgi:hypothetical protein